MCFQSLPRQFWVLFLFSFILLVPQSLPCQSWALFLFSFVLLIPQGQICLEQNLRGFYRARIESYLSWGQKLRNKFLFFCFRPVGSIRLFRIGSDFCWFPPVHFRDFPDQSDFPQIGPACWCTLCTAESIWINTGEIGSV